MLTFTSLPLKETITVAIFTRHLRLAQRRSSTSLIIFSLHGFCVLPRETPF